eukprot:1780345-Rhodomonas_salina.1
MQDTAAAKAVRTTLYMPPPSPDHPTYSLPVPLYLLPTRTTLPAPYPHHPNLLPTRSPVLT